MYPFDEEESTVSSRRNVLARLLGLGGLSALTKAGAAEQSPEAVFSGGLELFFAQRDNVTAFNPGNGLGTQVGTTEGVITGTSITNFQFIPTSQTTIKFDNRCLITDTSGDSIIFDVNGTGEFLIPPPSDPNSSLGNLLALGGPLVATYTVLSATGIYAFLVGQKFPAVFAAENAVGGSSGLLGTVYVEVFSNTVGIASANIRQAKALRLAKLANRIL
jgi:hypothetical protein